MLCPWPIRRRPVRRGMLLDNFFGEVNADGCHLVKELLQLIYKIKGPERICLVRDSMRSAGMPDGEYILGGKGKVYAA